MTADQAHAVLESSPVPTAPWHIAEECVVDIRDLEHYIRSSKSGGPSFSPQSEWNQRQSNNLCEAVGSLASMPFRYLSRSRTTPTEKRCNSSDGCSTIVTEEAISAFTPLLPDNSSDFIRSENSSDSHDANSYHALPQDLQEELEGSLPALSMNQSPPTYHQFPGPTHDSVCAPGATPPLSWMGALRNAVTKGRSTVSRPVGRKHNKESATEGPENAFNEDSIFHSLEFEGDNAGSHGGALLAASVRVD